MKQNRKKGFTLLEIIIVIIIVGVLAALALPRFFRMIEYSKATEAFNAFTALRGSIERCYLANSGNYVGCNATAGFGASAAFTALDIENPGSSPNAHFSYDLQSGTWDKTNYTIVATRNTLDGGAQGDTITLTQTGTTVTKRGKAGGAFESITK